MRRLIPALLVLGSPVMAQDFDLRAGDSRLSAEAVEMRLSGRVLTFYDDGKSEYYPDGRYTYTYAEDGGTAYGYWTVSETGAVCIEFVNGFERCDLYVEVGERMVMLDEKGARFPVRP